MAESSEKMPPYPDIFTDDFQMSDQVSAMSVNHNVYFLFADTFRQRFFGLSMSDHGIVWFDIWSKCKLYCVPSLRSIIAGWDILFSVFCFSIYFLKAWFLVEKVGFLVIIFSARKWRERRILHHLPQSFWGPLKAPRPPAVRSQMTLSQICVHIILG